MPVWQASSPARRAYGFAISNSLCKLSSGIDRLRPHNPWVTQLGARLIDLQPTLTDGRHLAEHRHEALLIHPLEELQGLGAEAHGWRCCRVRFHRQRLAVATRGEQNLCGDKPAAPKSGLKHLYSFCSVAAVALGGAFLGQQPCSSNPAFW